MNDLFSDNSGHSDLHEQLHHYLHENHADYATLIQQEATKIAKETLSNGGGVIEYQVPKRLLDHIIQKESNRPDKTAIKGLFREQVENTAFDLLIHQRRQLYSW